MANRMLLITGAFAEFERTLLREKQREELPRRPGKPVDRLSRAP